ncbi:MAG: DUF3276 family protein [Saprospiraceae bacterium]
MENNDSQRMESVYTSKVRAGRRRTYFFDVRQTKGEDYYITLTESTKKFNGDGYTRHKIFLYKEDFNRFLKGLQDTISHVKTKLMPDFDYELYEKRQLEWEEKIRSEGGDPNAPAPKPAAPKASDPEDTTDSSEVTETEDDITW